MCAQQAGAFARESVECGRKAPIGEALADELDGRVGRVEQIARIEAVIAQFVEHDFVGREINRAFVGRAHGIDREQQARFRKLRSVQAVFRVAVGTHRPHDVQVGALCAQAADRLEEEHREVVDRVGLSVKSADGCLWQLTTRRPSCSR